MKNIIKTILATAVILSSTSVGAISERVGDNLSTSEIVKVSSEKKFLTKRQKNKLVGTWRFSRFDSVMELAILEVKGTLFTYDLIVDGEIDSLNQTGFIKGNEIFWHTMFFNGGSIFASQLNKKITKGQYVEVFTQNMNCQQSPADTDQGNPIFVCEFLTPNGNSAEIGTMLKL